MVERIRMTASEFFQLPESNQPVELIEGELIMSPAPVPQHQAIIGEIYILLRSLISNGKLYLAPIDVYLDDENVPQPDIVWVAENGQCQVGETRLEGPPDLVVEVFSPSTAKLDKKEKYQLYQRYGVREYWMVDPVGQYVEVWVLVGGRFEQQGVYGPEETFESPVLGSKTIEVGRIFAT